MLTEPIQLEHGPGPKLAFVPTPDPDQLAITAVALANTDGGAIVLGLDENGGYHGPLDGSTVARILREATAQCIPAMPLSTPEIISTPGGPALAVRVPRGRGVHALADGRVLVRGLFGNRVLDGDEIRGLITTRSNGEFEAEVVPGARIADLDPALLADYMLALAQRSGGSRTHSGDVPLETLGAITPDHRVTVAGLLLFGREPAHWLPQNGAQFVRYVGRCDQNALVAFEQTFDGSLTRQLDQLWDALRAQWQAAPGTSPDARPYPEVAVREALANAVCHRDYRLRGDRIAVRLYADCLEISSPGGLPAFMTLTHLVGGHYSRNLRLARVLALWGYVQGTGGGMVRILNAMDRRGYRPPEITTGPYSVTVRLYPASADAGSTPLPPEDTLNERQCQALDYARAHGSITFHEFRTLRPMTRPELLLRDLSALVEAGYLRRIGSRGKAYYILP